MTHPQHPTRPDAARRRSRRAVHAAVVLLTLEAVAGLLRDGGSGQQPTVPVGTDHAPGFPWGVLTVGLLALVAVYTLARSRANRRVAWTEDQL